MSLHVRGLTVIFPGWPATLEGVDLDVPAGTSSFLLGPSGSGKSTFLRCIAGLHSPEAGRVFWDDEELTHRPTHKRGVGMLFQDAALFPHLNVLENVAFGLRYRGVPRSERRDEARHWLDVAKFNGRDEDKVLRLSGGERQRVALARTLAGKPRVVLLDEPFSALDRELRDELGPRVKSILAQQGVSAVWVTHDRDEARRLGDEVWRLEGAALRPVPLTDGFASSPAGLPR